MRILRNILIAIALLLSGAALAGGWIIYRAQPKLDGTITLEGLSHSVTVDRDTWGVPHIRANSLEDLVEAQGYVTAQDRLWQMDVLRRFGAGELSEIFGPNTLAIDVQVRQLGLRHAAELDAMTLTGDGRMILEAYARGVNRFIETHRNRLPAEFFLLRYKPQPWTPVDSMLILGYMYETLTTTWPREMNRDIVATRVDADRMAELYAVDSPDDRVVVGGQALPGKESSASPVRPSLKPQALSHTETPETAETAPPQDLSDMWKEAQGILTSFAEESRAALGSNNWVVDGTHTASGKPLLANDTHLDLVIPSIWYIVHLTAPEWNVKGFAIPGEPLVQIGHNDRIAWGFTNSGADVQDLYQERFNLDNVRQYLVNGKFVDATIRTERIKVRGRPDNLIDFMSTRHGPIVRREAGRQFALKWTALQPGALSHSYAWLGHAQNWQEFREALRDVSGPSQNVVYADVDGNIGFAMAGWIPIRKSGHGEVPVPGDTDEYEWTGYIPFDELPQVLNPPGGIIVTANARIVGPGYKHYITDRWESPYRTERIFDLLNDRKDLRPSDMNVIQNDIVALNDKSLGDAFVQAAKTVKPKDPRTTEIISRLANWDGSASINSAQTSFIEVTRDALMRNILEPYLSAATDEYQWRGSVFLDRILRERPPKWLPSEFHSYDELLIASGDQATVLLEASTHSKEVSAWGIGNVNALTMNHPLGQTGVLHRIFSIGPLAQSGSAYAPKAMTHTHGPAMRFVADLSDWDHSMMEVNSGESGVLGSKHYKDQFAEWFAGRAIVSPFSNAAEEKASVQHLTLAPVNAQRRAGQN